MSVPELVSVRLVDGGGLQLTLAEGVPRVVRLTHGDLNRLELWAEAETDIEDRIAALRAEIETVMVRLGDEAKAGQIGDTTPGDLGDAAKRLRHEAKDLAAQNRRNALEVWHGIPAIATLWPEPDDLPGTLSVRLLGEWRAAIEGDPFAHSPGQPLLAEVTVTSRPLSGSRSPG